MYLISAPLERFDLHSDDKQDPHGTEQSETGHLDSDTGQEDISTGLSLTDIG
jgi:hypothetical protein